MKRTIVSTVAVAGLMIISAACKRETRDLQKLPAQGDRQTPVQVGKLNPGPSLPGVVVKNPSDPNAYDISEGQRLFEWYNCTGCHSHGGGGIGPPLMDDKWIYGSEPENIHDTIVEGRTNGMPAFGGKIPDYQIWQLVAYVRSLGGLTPKLARPGRPDEMQQHAPDNLRKNQTPKDVAAPRP